MVEQALAHEECLGWLDPELSSIPIAHLDGARKAVNGPEHTDAVEELFGEVIEADFTHYRGMITHVNNTLARKFSPRPQSEIQSELLVTSGVLSYLPKAGSPAAMVKNGFDATNFDLFIAPRLPVSLSIFDDEAVFVSPRPEDASDNRLGASVSTDDVVVEWPIAFYEACREQSRRSPDHLINALLDGLDPSPRFTGLLSD